MMKIAKYIETPRTLIRSFGNHGFLNWLPYKPYLKIVYWSATGKKLNIDDPRTFSEKLQWLKLNDRKPEYTIYVDKYEVRSYIEKNIGQEYLIPIIGVYNNVDEIKWDLLPNKFAMKCTHGSGTNIICIDKGKLNIEVSINKLKKWVKKNWYWYGREWPYKNVKARIICEQFLTDNDEPPEDYKVMCFSGEAKLIQVHFNRFSKSHACDYYDINWIKSNISKMNKGVPNSNAIIPRPVFLEEMITLSEKIAKDMYHVRVDWYIVRNKLYFGEITFYSASGFSDFDKEDDNILLGSWINIDPRGGLK